MWILAKGSIRASQLIRYSMLGNADFFIDLLLHSSSVASVSPEVSEISVDNFTQSGAPIFSPDNVTVVIGVNSTVTWSFLAGPPQAVLGRITWISGPPCSPTFDSGPLQSGASFTFTFDTPGTYVQGSVGSLGTEGTVVVKAP
jgi:plastocyanin